MYINNAINRKKKENLENVKNMLRKMHTFWLQHL